MKDRHHPAGLHLIADLEGVAADKLTDALWLEQLLSRSAIAANATIVSSHFHHFGEAQGVTGMVMLAESHISIHTWPEHQFAAIDIFMCGTGLPQRALDLIIADLQPVKHTTHAIERVATPPSALLASIAH